MAGFNFGTFAQALASTEETGVTFEGKVKNWGTELEAQEVVDAIDACKHLQFLNLEGNTLGVGAARAIAAALEKHPEFKKALWKDLFTGRLKSEIPLALETLGKGMIKASAKLAILDCSDNALGPNGMKGLVDLLKSTTCYSLQELRLNNCGLGTSGGRMLAASLTECFEASTRAGTPFQLKVFIAGRNRLENDGAHALGKIFGRIGTLEEVAMPQNGITHDGIRALSDGFKSNENLKILNLNDNTITAKGAVALADAFECLHRLEEINLGDCLLRTGGAILLGEALQDGHNQLETLNLGFNEIGPDGGLSIATAMQNKPHISSIILNGNMFGTECRDTIAEMLSQYEKLDALGPLDEDDSDYEGDEDVGEDDEDDEENYDEEDEDNEYAESDTEEVDDDNTYNSKTNSLDTTLEQTIDLGLNNLSQSIHDNSSVYFNGEESRPICVETFCCTPNPSVEMFTAIKDTDKVSAFRNYLSTITEPDYLMYLAFAVLKLSAISGDCNEALDVSQALFKDCFDYAISTSQLTRVKNFFLIQLGLLKNEDKGFLPAYDLAACRSAVKHAIKLNTFTSEVTSTFELFLERFQ